MTASTKKRQHGRYFTEGNPFVLPAFQAWMKENKLEKEIVLEPYAGANNIIRALQQVGYAKKFVSYDISPQEAAVQKRNTLTSVPTGFRLVITNPPWLAKNSAHRRGLRFPKTEHDDLYKYALEKCLSESEYVAALIPATFLQSNLFFSRLDSVILLHERGMFSDTENPVCLALFSGESSDFDIHYDAKRIGSYSSLQDHLPPEQKRDASVIFNHPNGSLGFIAFDSTSGRTIRFCDAKEIEEYPIIHTSRMITRIDGSFPELPKLIRRLNKDIESFRDATNDVFLTPFKGLRKDGRYRRRMDYSLARRFITNYA